uniref:Uncharacterized protein n=1 Tax=Ixodes ricinus TaxID=34613 RepID=V5H012_IXORI
MDSETAFVIAIIVVFIVIGIFVFIYACCVTEEKLKNATKRKRRPRKKDDVRSSGPASTDACTGRRPLSSPREDKTNGRPALDPNPTSPLLPTYFGKVGNGKDRKGTSSSVQNRTTNPKKGGFASP